MSRPLSDKDPCLQQFCSHIQRHPVLTREQELSLARAYREDGCEQTAQKLVLHNLRFVLKIAEEYRGYGIRAVDLVQEGNIGLMVAVKKFDPERGYRLVSYAVWWIRAYIQSYIMRTWSLVKVGTTQAQRKLFFRLRSERERLERSLPPGEAASADDLAASLHVSCGEVEDMQVRLGERDFSIDAGHDSVWSGGSEVAGPESILGDRQRLELLRDKLRATLPTLADKERAILQQRVLADDPPTLQALGQRLGVSRERVRQIEAQAIGKLRDAVLAEEPAA